MENVRKNEKHENLFSTNIHRQRTISITKYNIKKKGKKVVENLEFV